MRRHLLSTLMHNKYTTQNNLCARQIPISVPDSLHVTCQAVVVQFEATTQLNTRRTWFESRLLRLNQTHMLRNTRRLTQTHTHTYILDVLSLCFVEKKSRQRSFWSTTAAESEWGQSLASVFVYVWKKERERERELQDRVNFSLLVSSASPPLSPLLLLLSVLLAVTRSDEMWGDVSTLSTSLLSPPCPHRDGERGGRREGGSWGWDQNNDRWRERVNQNLREREKRRKGREE